MVTPFVTTTGRTEKVPAFEAVLVIIALSVMYVLEKKKRW